ncbi:SDR family NAD(P)-dependent oxidoreductase [Caulobacter sp. 17J80-11]|uniref:SDR family NAD(P)-dependent oxidoreductase n=1 Tax=Caulobacter sp. 17J80-11 TaxID=2763502 RepID=UPI00165393B2|nr:SDR family NAD(P)-dependent oxidoreductase [Caulobacter sp. 17J80-11]MBC6982690.1 SDR family NAD(P)-dependent oxidoreductase [Caulobacter sp. 17J80-11]
MDRLTRPVLVTGGAGFIGSNLSDRLAREGHDVLVFDNLGRPGVELNLADLQARHPNRVRVRVGDLRDPDAVDQAVAQAGAIFHFAAQVAVTTSLEDPETDFDVNLAGTVGLLEAVRRHGGRTPVMFASTNKVYGDLADLVLESRPDGYAPLDPRLRERGVGEDRPLNFHTPYGCSKGAADQYVLDYARSYDLPACVLRMSCIYGPRQMGAEEQGWVAHFLKQALAGRPIRIFGDGRQVRDVLDVSDAVDAWISAWRRIDRVKGRAFNLGGGPVNAVSLRQVIDHIETLLGRSVEVEFLDWRPGDQRWFVSDPSAARLALGLPEPTPWRDGLAGLAEWLRGREPDDADLPLAIGGAAR